MGNKISIGIILYKNDEAETSRCFQSIQRQLSLDVVIEILIRDQGGGDCRPAVENWLERHPLPIPCRFSEGENLGFGGGHNLLFSQRNPAATAYLCLNPDGAMHPECLGSMIEKLDKTNGRGIYEARQEPIMHPKFYDPQSEATAWCSGACVLIPCDIYQAISGFDEDFFLYCEDVGLSWRVKAAGHGCYTCANALFLHYSVDRSNREVEIWRSACILAHKWRARDFKEMALNVLKGLIDIDHDQITRDIEKHQQHELELVYRAKPDFKHGLHFSHPMWA